MSDYRSIAALMLKDSDYGRLIASSDTIQTVQDALRFCDALEEVGKVWKEGLDAFNLQSHDECAAEANGAIIVYRMCILDLSTDGEWVEPQVPREEVAEHLIALQEAFKPMSLSYSQTPMLAQWYSSIPSKAAFVYNRLRGPFSCA